MKGSIDFLSFVFAVSKSIINYIKLCLFLKQESAIIDVEINEFLMCYANKIA